MGVPSPLSTRHSIRIDVKNGRAKVIIELIEYTGGAFNAKISEYYPIGKTHKSNKQYFVKAFYYSHLFAQNTLKEIGKYWRNRQKVGYKLLYSLLLLALE